MSDLPTKVIAVIATLDTKGPEAGFLRACIRQMGYGSIIFDTGILDRRDPAVPAPEITADAIAREGGEDRDELVRRAAERSGVEEVHSFIAQLRKATSRQ